MKNLMRGTLMAVLALGGAAAAQTPVKATSVMVMLTVKPGMRPKVQPLMQQEVKDTVQAYLDGRILQWYARANGDGVMFILNATTVEDAKAIMGALPLDKAGLVNLEFTPLAPLTPLRRLIVEPKP